IRRTWCASAMSRSARSRVRAWARASWCLSAVSSRIRAASRWSAARRAAASSRTCRRRRASTWAVTRARRAWRARSPGLAAPWARGRPDGRLGRGRGERVGTSVEPRLARRARLPALVHPQPLLGVAADHLLEDGGEALGVAAHVLGRVARALHLEDGEHVHAVAGAPALADDEGRHDGRVGAERDTGHAAVRARRQPEEVHEHPEPPGRVLVDGEHEEPALVERLQHPARAGALADHPGARPPAELGEPAVDERIGDGTVYHVDRVAALPVREDQELPVAEMPAQDEDTGAALPADRLLP